MTEQEIYDALYAGDLDAIDEARAAAEDPDQFQADYMAAWTHYQADHEAPEEQREADQAASVETENA